MAKRLHKIIGVQVRTFDIIINEAFQNINKNLLESSFSKKYALSFFTFNTSLI